MCLIDPFINPVNYITIQYFHQCMNVLLYHVIRKECITTNIITCTIDTRTDKIIITTETTTYSTVTTTTTNTTINITIESC